jgi:hypothetical protein
LGFTRISVSGAPTSFNSFALQGAETGTIGYLVKLDTIKMDQLTIGQEYKTATEVTFGLTDAFVYDSEGEVFYAIGRKYDDKTYYSIADLETGGIAVEEEPPVDISLIKGVNPPVIGTEMTKVYWEGFSEIEKGNPSFDEANWYDYIAQTGATTSGGTSKWANAKVDGSYFVWIPRYAYKITYYTSSAKTTISGTTTAYGNIDVLFMHGTSSTKYIDRETNSEQDLPSGYVVHPAFTTNLSLGGWDRELTGIWIAKYEASRNDATNSSAGIENLIKMVPGVVSLRSINVGAMFTKALDFKSGLNSHMMKNSEYGAVAYLTHSKYGRNATEVSINNNYNWLTGYAGETINAASSDPTYAYNTDKGVLASTTGNIYGIYDMSGGSWEYTPAYYKGGSSSYLAYGSSFVYIKDTTTVNTQSTKYATVYDGVTASSYYKIGDATYETSSWNGDYVSFIRSSYPFFGRGGSYGNTNVAGLFFYDDHTGFGENYTGFRVSLIGN